MNWKKSNLVPSQTIQYLGAIFNFQLGLIYPTEDRHLSLLQAIARMENLSQVSAQWFLRLLGLMTACIGLVPAAHLHMRPIQFYLLHFWRPHKDSLDSLVPIRQFLVDHLQWWKIRQHIFVGVPLQEKHSVTLWTDASVHGLGRTHGLFTSVRQMGQTSPRLPHKLAGNESGSVGIGTFQTTCQESVCSASLRQFDSGVVYQQARRNEVVQPLSFDVGVTPVVPGELDCFESGTYSRETEYFGRRFEPRENSNTFNRVEFESGNSGHFIQNISNSKSRSVCNKREQETTSLLFPLIRTRKQ